MDWLSSAVDPHQCIFVNESIVISCTNLASPSFALTFTYDTMLTHNPQLPDSTTLVIKLDGTLEANNTEHHLQIHLYNSVENLKKISPSLEIYLINKDGLVYEENLNFGSIVYKPPITNILDVSILNDQSQNEPGQLSTLKVEVNISVPVSTTYSTLFFILQ